VRHGSRISLLLRQCQSCVLYRNIENMVSKETQTMHESKLGDNRDVYFGAEVAEETAARIGGTVARSATTTTASVFFPVA
jgi:hypothetical protein